MFIASRSFQVCALVGLLFAASTYSTFEAPKVIVSAEPLESGQIVYLHMAAEKAGGPQKGQMSLRLSVQNQEAKQIRLNKVTATFTGPPKVATATIAANFTVPAGAIGLWNHENDKNIILPYPAPKSVTLSLYFDGFTDPATITKNLAPHKSPVAGGAYLFPAKASDLRFNEFWSAHTGHATGNQGSQLFAYDMGVVGYDDASKSWSDFLPGTKGEKNTDFRIWGKPVYAMADGTVLESLNDVPSNPHPIIAKDKKDEEKKVKEQMDKYWGKFKYGGAGNHFYIQHGDEVVMYAHMQPGSLNKKLLATGSKVKAGDFLGLAGNAGSSSGPHLHIHAIQGTVPETGPLRPLPFRNIHVIARSALKAHDPNGPWVNVTGAGPPSADSFVWPAASKPTWAPPRTGASIIQSSLGNLEVVAHEGHELWHWYFVPGKAWARGSVITAKATGPGAITQNKNGNFEVVALEGRDIVHYWTAPGKPYNRGAVITTKASGPGSIIFGSVGNLEAVILEGNELAHYYFAKGNWSRGAVITNKATGPGTIAQNKNGNFEVVVPEGKDLVHYWTAPGKPYNRGAVICNKATGAASIVQGASGNMEVIVPEGKELVHYWFDKAWRRGGVITNTMDRMGVGALCRNRNNNLEAVLIEGNQIVHFREEPGKGWNRGASY